LEILSRAFILIFTGMNRNTLPFAVLIILLTTVGAAPPAWWSDPQTQILEPGGTVAENYAPVNLGQLKHAAAMAKKHLDKELSLWGGAGSQIDALVASFEPRSGQGYPRIWGS
jgi:hypothetical protein